MKVNTFKYFFLDSLISLKRNITLTIVSVITISATLFIFGLFIIYLQSVSENFNNKYIYNENLVAVLGYFKLVVLILLPPISIFLIVNELKMVIFSRKNEINIMKTIGATNWFIRWPFIIQGIVMGIIGAFLANLSLFYVYSFISNKIINLVTELRLEEPYFIINTMLLPFIIVGVFIGAMGSIFALRKVLKSP